MDIFVGLMGEQIMAPIAQHETENDKKARQTPHLCQRKDSNGDVVVTGNYYENSGKYQHTYDQILEKYVPERGKPTTGGEEALLVYTLFKLQREWTHNFFGNVDLDALQDIDDIQTFTCESFDWPYHKMLGFLANNSNAAVSILKELWEEAKNVEIQNYRDRSRYAR